jgi:Cu(I)/Ag(I) efflux system protein CusF
MNRFAYALLAAVALAAPAAFAEEEHDHDKHSAKAASAAKLTSGEVRKIDKAAGKISIAHEPIENLGMPKMTMVYRVKEPGMLDVVKEGDKVNFAADKIQGVFTVTRIETAK